MTVVRTSIKGATAFPTARLQALIAGLEGANIPVSRIEERRVALLGLYRESGFTFTTVDVVLAQDGTLRFAVGESQVVEVLLDGDIGSAGNKVLDFLNHLRDARPLDIATLERWLLLARDIPGITVQPVLRPAGTAPGALTLVAQVRRRAVTGYLTADNRADGLTGPEQLLTAVQLNSFTSLGESTEFSFFGAARGSQLFGQAAEEFFVGTSGLRVRLYAGHGDAHPSGLLRQIGYQGETTVAGASVNYPLIRRRAYNLALVGAFDAIESDTDIDNPQGGTIRLSHDALRVLRAGADGSLYDNLLGDTRSAANQLTVRISQGLDSFGASTSARTGAQVSFTKISAEATRVQTLFAPWNDATVALQTTLAGQWTNDVLPLSEKFYLGGARLGRGFFAGQVTGDRALSASAELQLTTAIDTQAFGQALHLQPMLYAFYDWGQAWQLKPSEANRRLQSVGGGLRLPVNDRIELQVEGVHRLTRQPNGAASGRLPANAAFWRVVVRL